MQNRTSTPRRGLVFLTGENRARYEADVLEQTARINCTKVFLRTAAGSRWVSDRTIPMRSIREIRYDR